MIEWRVAFPPGWSDGDYRAAFADLTARLLGSGLPIPHAEPSAVAPSRYFVNADAAQADRVRAVAFAWLRDHRITLVIDG